MRRRTTMQHVQRSRAQRSRIPPPAAPPTRAGERLAEPLDPEGVVPPPSNAGRADGDADAATAGPTDAADVTELAGTPDRAAAAEMNDPRARPPPPLLPLPPIPALAAILLLLKAARRTSRLGDRAGEPETIPEHERDETASDTVVVAGPRARRSPGPATVDQPEGRASRPRRRWFKDVHRPDSSVLTASAAVAVTDVPLMSVALVMATLCRDTLR